MSALASLLSGRSGLFRAPHPVVRELVRLLALLGAGSIALVVGLTALELATARHEGLLYQFHQPAIVLTSSLYATYAAAQSPAGIAPRGERAPELDTLFVGQMQVAYEKMLALGDQLLALYAAHREYPFETGAARLSRSLRQLRELHDGSDGDERVFAEALTASHLSLSLVVQQLERLHQDAARDLTASIASTRVAARIVYGVLALALLAIMGAFARRSMTTIWASLERERSAKEALLIKEQAMATSITPLAITDGAERVIYVNPAFVKLGGFASEAQALGRRIAELTSEDAMAAVRASLRRTGNWQGELSAVKADGARVDVLFSASAVAGRAEEPAYVMISALDLTERRRLEAELLQAQKMESIGRLAGGVAHDFNNLLTGINGSVEFGLEQLPPESPVREALADIKMASDSAANLVRQLLAFSRRQVIQPRIVDLNEVIEGLGRMLPRLLGEDVALRIEADAGLGRVRLDPGQAEQVLLNLAVNAKDAMPHGGELVIETANVTLDEEYCARHPSTRPGPHVMVAVSDTGAGIPPEVKAHIFEPFFTTKPRGRGTGLGLATVYGVVKQNAGSVEVYSEPGSGSTFKVYLPRVDAEPDAPARERAAARGSEVIFLVEDDDRVRVVAERALSRCGYVVHAFAQGADAIAAVASVPERPALLVTDVVLGGMSGAEVAARVREVVPGIKVIFSSGYTENVIVQHGVLEEGVDFVAKPYSPEILGRRVREALDRSGRA